MIRGGFDKIGSSASFHPSDVSQALQIVLLGGTTTEAS
jgi:hypothetical protein